MKKILIMSLVYSPHPLSGAEFAIKEITDRVSDYEFHMLTLRFDRSLPRYEKVGNVHVYRIGFTKKNFVWPMAKDFPLHLNKYYFQGLAPLMAAYLHFKHRYSIVWAMMAHSTGIPSGIFKTFFPKVKYVLTLQEGDPIEHIEKTAKKLGPLSWNLFTRGFTKADAITAISNYLSNWAKTLNKKVEPILVYNGANQKDLANEVDAKDVETIKQKIGKKEGDVFLVNTSRVVHQKGIDTVVRALPLLPKNIKFVAVGDGDKMDEYKALAQELGVSDRVTFTGRVDRNQTPVYRKASDIFVATSRSEGLGSTFLSAMACGLPLITTGVGGIADYAFDGKTAYIVPVDDPAAIAKKVEQVLKEKDEAKTICSNARRLIEEEYNWDSVTKKMKEKVFDYVLLTQNSKYSTEEARRAPLG